MWYPERALPLIALVVSSCLSACVSTGRVVPPIAVDDPFPTASPAEVGLDFTDLERISAELETSDEHDIHSMLVVRSGRLVFEAYYGGHARDNPHDIRSATKSVTSLLTGIALDRGAIADIDDPLSRYLGDEYASESLGEGVRLRHLLTMTSGLDCDDMDRSTRGQEDRMYRSEDWLAYFSTLERTFAPGDTARYCTGGVVALGEAVARAVDQDIAAFAEEALFGPLGIRNYQWARFDDGRKVDTGGHLLLTPQAMAKIGMLVLQDGMWDGKRVVSEEWLRRSTAASTAIDGAPYGFLWWIDTIPFGQKEVRLIRASGNGGQTIFIVPEYDMVAVFTGGYYNSDRTRVIYELFYNGVMRSIPEIAGYLGRGTGGAVMNDDGLLR